MARYIVVTPEKMTGMEGRRCWRFPHYLKPSYGVIREKLDQLNLINSVLPDVWGDGYTVTDIAYVIVDTEDEQIWNKISQMSGDISKRIFETMLSNTKVPYNPDTPFFPKPSKEE